MCCDFLVKAFDKSHKKNSRLYSGIQSAVEYLAKVNSEDDYYS